MKFQSDYSEIFVPDGLPEKEALARTTHMGISAHQDDLEIMAMDGILRCFQQDERWFTGVVVTDGAGSPRAGLYQRYTDEQMKVVRIKEQKKAAVVGEYGAQVFLGYPSSAVKNAVDRRPVEDLAALIRAARPQVIYTHNLADKHPTHIAVALRVLAALRSLPHAERPQKFYGCEVWRDLDWMMDNEKVVFDCSLQDNIQAALVSVFDSQVTGGKRYDHATEGRRVANATYFASHGVDEASRLSFGMDLTPLIEDDTLDVQDYVLGHIERFAQEVRSMLAGLK